MTVSARLFPEPVPPPRPVAVQTGERGVPTTVVVDDRTWPPLDLRAIAAALRAGRQALLLAVLGVLLVGGVVLAGCGGDPPDTSSLDPAAGNPTLENNGGDVRYETDFRSVYARVIDNWIRRVRRRGVSLPIQLGLAGPVERLRSNFINGIKHLPVRFSPE